MSPDRLCCADIPPSLRLEAAATHDTTSGGSSQLYVSIFCVLATYHPLYAHRNFTVVKMHCAATQCLHPRKGR